jgi:hypothetical protein
MQSYLPALLYPHLNYEFMFVIHNQIQFIPFFSTGVHGMNFC